MTDDQLVDRRIRAFTALEALRQTLGLLISSGDTKAAAGVDLVRQYDTALDHLTACGEDVKQYRTGKNANGVLPMYATELFGVVSIVLGYFTFREAVKQQADATGAALGSLIGFETPKGR
jgi:hypothetical protein